MREHHEDGGQCGGREIRCRQIQSRAKA
jgi:hypothetical protein